MKLGTLCYIERDGRYLMLHRTKKRNDMHEGLWVGLGGKFEAGESPEDCVVREVYEESGLRVRNPQLRAILTFPSDFNQEDWYVFLFTAAEFDGEVRQCEEGELCWIDKDKLDSLPMHAGDRRFLAWIREHTGILSAKYIYEGEEIKDCHMAVYR